MSEPISISVVTRLQDNGDGGYTMYCYNTEEEMLEDHPLNRGNGLTEKQRRDILIEDDPYENGYIGSETINIEVDQNGARLSKPLCFSVGQ